MELHNLRPAKGAVKTRKRVGRGQGSGRGGTSTRGHKGAGSRSGDYTKVGFEGGQMPIQRRLPKIGFNSPNRIEVVPMNLERLQAIADKYQVTDITPAFLVEKGIVGQGDYFKVLGRGELSSSISVTAHAVSATAKAAIEAKGGSVNLV
jgi:large subunit ribosomal protein L15